MDLADIRQKANIQKKQGTDLGCNADKVAPSIQGAPFDERLPIRQGASASITQELQFQASEDSIQKLFDCPYQIDLIEEDSLRDLTKKDLDANDKQHQWLTFSLSSEEYAVDIESVNEIIKPREVTDIPRVPGFILGIITLRGIIVPIFDLARRLDLGNVDISTQSRVVVCQHEENLVGLLVDNISQVVKIKEKKIEIPPSVLSGLKREFVSGIGRYQGRMLIRLNLKNVLNPELV